MLWPISSPWPWTKVKVFLTKIAIFSLLNKIFESSLLQKVVLLRGHVMTVKNMTIKSRFRVKLKTKISKCKYSVLVACHMSNAVNKASYLEIFCCNALSTCTKVADLLVLNYMVRKFRKSARNWQSYEEFPNCPGNLWKATSPAILTFALMR
jgi:hypothetical protein